jgi:NO-binding membrane sensor protein with MHYT domain
VLYHLLYCTYDLRLVAISVAIAVLASYTALTFAAQVTYATSWQKLAWLSSGAIAMGTGIWSMHFVGMLAFQLPIAVHYDLLMVVLSLAAAIGASGIALRTVSQVTFSSRAWLNSGVWMGLGIAVMHYSGMAAMRLPAVVHYDAWLVGLSVVVAIGVALVALPIVFRLRHQDASTLQKISGALLMGAAIPAMHYIGMAAARFELQGQPMASEVAHLSTNWLSSAVCLVTLFVLGVSLLVTLEIRVKERTDDLSLANQQLANTIAHLQQTQAQLIHSEKMSGLGEMVAGIAHEIKNPTHFIVGNLDYLNRYTASTLMLLELCQQQSAQLPSAIQDYLRQVDAAFLAEDYPKVVNSIGTGIERITEIVTSLRSFSQMEADEKAMVNTNLHQGIDSTLLILHHRLKSSQIQVEKSYGDIPGVECHPGQINQVLMNLLANAIDALEETNEKAVAAGDRAIQITTSSTATNVMIKITDNGMGMTSETQARLFEAFYTTKGKDKGTGLGLSISHQIVTKTHQGQLTCRSQPRQGSEFTIQLPITQSPKLTTEN